ncbi:MAG: hypothetical protein WBN51_03320 [Gammaproteobacteria bacterium]
MKAIKTALGAAFVVSLAALPLSSAHAWGGWGPWGGDNYGSDWGPFDGDGWGDMNFNMSGGGRGSG